MLASKEREEREGVTLARLFKSPRDTSGSSNGMPKY